MRWTGYLAQPNNQLHQGRTLCIRLSYRPPVPTSISTSVPPDIIYPLYFINGYRSDQPITLNVVRGDKVRLRFINASSATIYHVALQGYHMTVTHTDGQAVEPVEVDALRIGMGERYDVLVTANNPGVWQQR